MSARCAVFGHPVGHSLSPRIHQRFAEAVGQPVDYEAREIPLEGFEPAVRDFFSQEGGTGINVTVPFKETAWALAERRSHRAERAGAVNTLGLTDQGHIWGDNTDGIGLVTDLASGLGWPLRDREILILGAGGAVRGILQPLLEQRIGALHLTNRTRAKADTLAEDFAAMGSIHVHPWDPTAWPTRLDGLINGTSSGFSGDRPPLPEGLLHGEGWGYDLVYGPAAAPFLAGLRAMGVQRVSDGLGMLVEQAAESFYLWHGVRPPTAGIREALRAA